MGKINLNKNLKSRLFYIKKISFNAYNQLFMILVLTFIYD